MTNRPRAEAAWRLRAHDKTPCVKNASCRANRALPICVANLPKSRTNDFVKSNRSTIHEVGHGLYIDGIPSNMMFTPLGKLMGTGVEEGIAFLTEKMVTRSRSYAQFITHEASNVFDKEIPWQDYYRVRTWVEKSLIRVAADEVTYPLHTYIRMQIERDVINGKMDVEDIPERWNDLYRRMLNKAPETPAEGFIQDAHWYVGKVGMFPFYTVGDAIAAQLWRTLRRDIPTCDEQIKAGNMSAIRVWLNQHVFAKGRFLDIDEFMIATTGEPLSAKYLVEHLEHRYLEDR